MARIMDGAVCIMHDRKENVRTAYRAMMAAGANVTYKED